MPVLEGITSSSLIIVVKKYLGTYLGGKIVPNSLSYTHSSLIVCGNVFVVFLLYRCRFVTMSSGMKYNK